jgi:hypothetical protein
MVGISDPTAATTRFIPMRWAAIEKHDRVGDGVTLKDRRAFSKQLLSLHRDIRGVFRFFQ